MVSHRDNEQSPLVRVRRQGALVWAERSLTEAERKSAADALALAGSGSGAGRAYTSRARLRSLKRLVPWLTACRDCGLVMGFVTLTFRRVADWVDTGATVADVQDVLRRLWIEWRRRYPSASVFWYVECTKKGAPHVHAVIEGVGPDEWEWLVARWLALTAGVSVGGIAGGARAGQDARDCDSSSALALYVAKEITKQAQKTGWRGRHWGVVNRRAFEFLCGLVPEQDADVPASEIAAFWIGLAVQSPRRPLVFMRWLSYGDNALPSYAVVGGDWDGIRERGRAVRSALSEWRVIPGHVEQQFARTDDAVLTARDASKDGLAAYARRVEVASTADRVAGLWTCRGYRLRIGRVERPDRLPAAMWWVEREVGDGRMVHDWPRVRDGALADGSWIDAARLVERRERSERG